MADKIQIRRGNKSALPALADGELAIAKDERALYAGIDGKNYPMGGAENYSTTEKVIGTWIDGRPVYRRAVFRDLTSTEKALNELEDSFGTKLLNINLHFYGGTTDMDTSFIEATIKNNGGSVIGWSASAKAASVCGYVDYIK